MKKFLLGLLIVMLVGSFFAGCSKEAEEVVEAPGAEFIIVNGAEPESLDPHLISGVPEHRIYESIFEGLLAYDAETAEGVPGVAESWTVSADKLTYTFKLRKTSWSDGVAITAQTVVDSWLRMLSPELAAPYAWFPSMFIAGAADYNAGEAGPESVKIKAVDDYTFEMTLVGPLPYVEGALPHYSFAIVPMHAIEKYGDAWTNHENFVGNGPFILDTWKPQEELTAVPNDKYWDKDAVSLSKVTYIPIDDNNTGYNMFLNGECDWMVTVPLDQMDSAKLRDDYHNALYLGTYYYIFNIGAEPFTDVRVRKALTMAIDRKELIDKVVKGGQTPAYSMVPGMTGYPGVTGNTEDIAAAKALLAEAGYPDGAGFPKFEILYNTSDAHKKIAEYIQQQWLENLGIDVELVNQEWKTYLTSRRQHEFQVARAGWIGDYQDPNTFLDMFITGGAMNGGQFANDVFDTNIGKAATMEPGAGRFKTLTEAEEIFITQEQAVMPIYHYTSMNMIDVSKWGGWHVNTMDFHPPKDIYLK
ncbi:MAG: peptide ABC transporter substrate-binding protein [Spirochaetia bacterium]|nr:peptide ABC transporter substrate-binding protein [Spirochaetia bacterium]